MAATGRFFDGDIRVDDVRGRGRAGMLARSDPKRAATVARAIRHPWYRCQALATVAQHWPDLGKKRSLLAEAFAAASTLRDLNRVVSASSWPLQPLVQLDAEGAAAKVHELIRLAAGESHSLRRADALILVAEAVKSNAELLAQVLPALIDALLDGVGWRIDRLIGRTLQQFGSLDALDVQRLLTHHSEGRVKRRLLRKLVDAPHDGGAHPA